MAASEDSIDLQTYGVVSDIESKHSLTYGEWPHKNGKHSLSDVECPLFTTIHTLKSLVLRLTKSYRVCHSDFDFDQRSHGVVGKITGHVNARGICFIVWTHAKCPRDLSRVLQQAPSSAQSVCISTRRMIRKISAPTYTTHIRIKMGCALRGFVF